MEIKFLSSFSKKSIGFIGCLVMYGSICFGQNYPTARFDTLSLNRYLSIVAQNNKEYAAQRFNVDISTANQELAKIIPDPSISFGAFDNGQAVMRMGFGFSIGMGGTLELGGKRKARVNLAESQNEWNKAMLRSYFGSLRADATINYLQALRVLSLYQVKGYSYSTMNKISKSDSIRYKLGSIMEINMLQSKLEAGMLLNDMLQAEADYYSALVKLRLMSGLKSTDSTFYPKGDLKKAFRVFNLDSLIVTAQNNRADLMAANQNKDVAQKNLRLVQANRVIDLGLGIGVNNTSYVTNYVAPTPSFTTLYGGVSVPLRFSNQYKGDLKIAQYQSKQADLFYEQIEMKIEAEVAEAYFQYMAARKQVEQFDRGLLDYSHRVLEGKIYSYQRGETSLLEVLNAQRTYNDVQISYQQTLYGFAAALVELERAVGIWDISF